LAIERADLAIRTKNAASKTPLRVDKNTILSTLGVDARKSLQTPDNSNRKSDMDELGVATFAMRGYYYGRRQPLWYGISRELV